LVAVSKTKPIEMLQAAYDTGCRNFGENYVQELVDKVPLLPNDVQWHFIGSLQSNKASMLIGAFPSVKQLMVETVDSIKLATKLNNAVPDNGDRLKVFVQVNSSGEDSKSGVSPGEECKALCENIVKSCVKLEFCGLMTIGAPGDEGCFSVLKDCRAVVAEALGMDEQFLEPGPTQARHDEERHVQSSSNLLEDERQGR
jgi:PLP dependent protein